MGLKTSYREGLESGRFLAYTTFKHIAKGRVNDIDQTLLLTQSFMYPSHKLYRKICIGPVYEYWLVAKQQPTLVRACGTLCMLVTGQMERKGNYMSDSCLCVKEVNCSYQIEHVLFYCTRNAEARAELYSNVLDGMEPDYMIMFQNLSNNQKVITMLKGYEEGNDVLLCNTARFIHIMVQQYLTGSL